MTEPRQERKLSELARYLRTETVGGFVLLAATVVALVWANSSISAISGLRASIASMPPERMRSSDIVAQHTPSRMATAWNDNLPQQHRPHHLLSEYPRVANRIALRWDDPTLADRIFDELLTDRRGGRRGFPVAVAGELLQLHVLHERRAMPVAESSAWSTGARPLR